MVCLYSKIPKNFTRIIFSDPFWLMLILFWFNMDSIRSTNFPMNMPFDPIMPSFILSWSKFGTFTWNVISCLISPTTHFAFRLLVWFVNLPFNYISSNGLFLGSKYHFFLSHFMVQFRHCHLFWFPTSLVCHTNWPCNIFSSQEIVLSSFFCFLVSIVISRTGSIKSVSTDFVAVSKRSLDSYVVFWS